MENCLAEIRAISQNKMLKIIYGDEQRGWFPSRWIEHSDVISRFRLFLE
jgi:hypothetical protein